MAKDAGIIMTLLNNTKQSVQYFRGCKFLAYKN